MNLKKKIYRLLRWSEKYTKTDMLYLVRGGFWLNLSQIVASLTSFVLAVAFANLISKETYGVYKFVLSAATILAIPTLSGINTAVIRAVAQGRERLVIDGLRTKLTWGLLATLASLGLAGYYFLKGNGNLAICFFIAAFFLPLLESFPIYQCFWSGRKIFRTLAKYQIITQLVSALCLLSVILFSKNLYLILLAYFLAFTLLHFIFLRLTLRNINSEADRDPGKAPMFSKLCKIFIQPNREHRDETSVRSGLCQLNSVSREDAAVISYGKHLSLMGIIGVVAKYFDKIIVWHFLGAEYLAVYCFAAAPPDKVSQVFSSLSQLALPKFSRHSPEETKKNLLTKILKLFLFLVPAAALYILMAPYLYKILFPQYLGSTPYSQFFALSFLLTPQILLSTFLTSQAKKKELYIFNFLSPACRIILLLVLLPLYGLWGTVTAILISQTISFGLLLFLFKVKIGSQSG